MNISPELETLVPLGKNQFPKTGRPVLSWWQQIGRLVMQSRASPPSPIFSKITILLFWYGVPLNEKWTPAAPGKEEVDRSTNVTTYASVVETCSISETANRQRGSHGFLLGWPEHQCYEGTFWLLKYCSYKLCTGSAKEHLRLQLNFARLFSRRTNVPIWFLSSDNTCKVWCGHWWYSVHLWSSLLQYFKMLTWLVCNHYLVVSDHMLEGQRSWVEPPQGTISVLL